MYKKRLLQSLLLLLLTAALCGCVKRTTGSGGLAGLIDEQNQTNSETTATDAQSCRFSMGLIVSPSRTQ